VAKVARVKIEEETGKKVIGKFKHKGELSLKRG